MSAVPEHRLKQVKGLVKAIPDGPLRSLDNALALSSDPAMQEVRQIIIDERGFRYVKTLVFAPYIPLFELRDDDLNSVIFPRFILSNVWRALEDHEPELFEEAYETARHMNPTDSAPVIFYRLITAAAELLRERPQDILPPKPRKDDPAEVAEFAHYLDMHRVLRDALIKMPNWLGRIDAERAAELRVLYKDACALSDDNGTRFMETLFANMENGVQIMKLIAAVSDRPNDRFLAESELADFGERVLELIEERVLALRQLMEQPFRIEDNPHAIGGAVSFCLSNIHALESAIELSREGPWGQRVAAARKTIATLVESRIKSAEKSLGPALPTKMARGGLPHPKLDKPLDERELAKAERSMMFLHEIRNHASQGGFASLHAKTLQTIEVFLDSYMQDLLATANSDEVFDADRLRTFFEATIRMIEAAFGEERANLARRRMASSALYKDSEAQDQDGAA